MAIGPDHQIGLACSGADALIIDDRTGKQIKLLTGLGGADEMWYNPGDNHYFFGISTPGTLGVADADPPAVDTSAKSAAGSHSVAADAFRNQVYVPIRGNNGASTGGSANICSAAKDVFGNAGSDALGCIAVYTAPHDDRRARR